MMTSITARQFDTGTPVRIRLRNGKIDSVIPTELPAADTDQLPFVGPGLFDIQVNGYEGIWFSSETLTVEQVEYVIRAFLRQGITRCLPTLITNSSEAIEHGLQTIRHACEKSQLVRHVVAGCHIEGPFISPEDGPRGAHPLIHIRAADFAEFARWQRAAGGLVRLVTLAPEVPNALPFIKQLVDSGVVVSIGHTAADSSTILQAINCGAKLGTHLGNGCAGLIPRHDNVFWPQLADDRLTCSVIADGWHVPATMLNCIVRCKSLSRLVLTSDVSGFGGCKPGRYATPGMDVEVLADGRIVVAGQTQFLAGSGATTGECVAHLMNCCGIPLSAAWPLASIQPSRLLSVPIGTLTEGSPAHLTVFRLEQLPASDSGKAIVRYQPELAISGGLTV